MWRKVAASEKCAAVRLDDPFPARSFYACRGDWFGTLVLWLTAFWSGLAFWAWPATSSC